jgi:hypothetical protein
MKQLYINLKLVFIKSTPKILQELINKFYVNTGYNFFIRNGLTKSKTYLSLIKLYCSTNGRYIEKLANKIATPLKNPSFPINGILGITNKQYFEEINENLSKEGYFIFNTKLDKISLEELLIFAKKTNTTYPPNYKEKTLFDENNLKAEIYRFNQDDLINNKIIQKIISDKTLIQVAREYLNAEPIFDFPAMWWSTTFSKEASEEAAQMYHYDFDRLKWLKLFIYLTDVDESNGPHCYISSSHIVDSKPLEILKRGYVRVSDKELLPYYNTNQIKTICASAGTIFVGDTKCWHKGTPLHKGVRLVLELQYTSSLFGVNNPSMNLSKSHNHEFAKFCLENKFYTSNINIIQ